MTTGPDFRSAILDEDLTRLADELATHAATAWAFNRFDPVRHWCDKAQVQLFEHPGTVDGRYYAQGSPTVVVRAGLPDTALRFTVAHELGHHLFHLCRHDADTRRALTFQSRMQLARFATASEVEEQLCDLVAAILLLPAQSAQAWVNGGLANARSLLRLCDSHGIRPDAALLRLHIATGFEGSLLALWADSRHELLATTTKRQWPIRPDAVICAAPHAMEYARYNEQPTWWDWSVHGQISHRTKATCARSGNGKVFMLVHAIASMSGFGRVNTVNL